MVTMALEIRNSNRYGPLTEDQILVLERVLGSRLPEDYRSFQLLPNGGRPTLSVFKFDKDGKQEESILEWFFAIHNGSGRRQSSADSDEVKLPSYFDQPLEEVWAYILSEQPNAKVLPIGRDPAGNLISIGYAGDWKNSIWWYDEETEFFYAVASSFSEFLAGLTKLQPGDWEDWLMVD